MDRGLPSSALSPSGSSSRFSAWVLSRRALCQVVMEMSWEGRSPPATPRRRRKPSHQHSSTKTGTEGTARERGPTQWSEATCESGRCYYFSRERPLFAKCQIPTRPRALAGRGSRTGKKSTLRRLTVAHRVPQRVARWGQGDGSPGSGRAPGLRAAGAGAGTGGRARGPGRASSGRSANPTKSPQGPKRNPRCRLCGEQLPAQAVIRTRGESAARRTEGRARASDVTGGPARACDATGGPARASDATGGPARACDATGGPARACDATGGPARASDATGGPARASDATGGPAGPLTPPGASAASQVARRSGACSPRRPVLPWRAAGFRVPRPRGPERDRGRPPSSSGRKFALSRFSPITGNDGETRVLLLTTRADASSRLRTFYAAGFAARQLLGRRREPADGRTDGRTVSAALPKNRGEHSGGASFSENKCREETLRHRSCCSRGVRGRDRAGRSSRPPELSGRREAVGATRTKGSLLFCPSGGQSAGFTFLLQSAVTSLYRLTLGRFALVRPWSQAAAAGSKWKCQLLRTRHPAQEGSREKKSAVKKGTPDHVNKEHNPLETRQGFYSSQLAARGRLSSAVSPQARANDALPAAVRGRENIQRVANGDHLWDLKK
ncbi:uncharacterized protein DKFZp434B061-like [Lontra canadensis]|uniref:uncharacterized protein DKFZp434B061-like n=1 Tax=Lontra canadensis TaxID=76717 RepID=UPI0013F369B5|nr:uncharacterized protein DKFZp434B061-like [Lontra canadensis]